MSHRLLSRVRGGHRSPPPLPFYPADNIDLGCCVREHPPGKHRVLSDIKAGFGGEWPLPHTRSRGGKCLVRFNGTLIDSMGPLAARPALTRPIRPVFAVAGGHHEGRHSQQQHGQHLPSQESCGAAEDGGVHGQDKGKSFWAVSTRTRPLAK